MPHPYFEVSKYPWHRQEASAFHRALYEGITKQQEVINWYDRCGANLPPLAPNNVKNMWQEALDNLCPKGFLKRLVEQLSADFDPTTPLGQLLAQVQAATSPLALPILPHGEVVLDRDSMRQAIGKLQLDNGQIKVLLVRGDPRSGKSHGRHLFLHAAAENGAIPVYLEARTVSTLEDVLINLFAALGATPPPTPDTTESAWWNKVCVELMKTARQAKSSLWIAMDDLGLDAQGAPLLDGSIRQFFDQFVLHMGNPAFAMWFRLMLIHYPPQAPTRWQNNYWSETRTTCADITEEHVAALLRAWSTIHNRTILESQILDLSRDTIAQADAPAPLVPPGESPPSPLSRLERLDNAVKSMLDDLARRP